MASRFVVCKDKEEALSMFEAGMLWLNWGADHPSSARPVDRWVVSERYGRMAWGTRDFLYLIEEDEDDPAQ